MIILDTNVVSELMKPAPADRVIRWVASQTAISLYTTSITYAEILHGILLLPASKRRKNFEQAAEMMFDEDFAGRIRSTSALPRPEIPVESVQNEGVRIEHAADPAHHVVVLLVRPIGKNLEEKLSCVRSYTRLPSDGCRCMRERVYR